MTCKMLFFGTGFGLTNRIRYTTIATIYDLSIGFVQVLNTSVGNIGIKDIGNEFFMSLLTRFE